ncbi:MAG TPA: hypothetical protein VFL80_03075 [Thermoanaerobaculia bacterium]|nr:hypothetical protein [Thermoanaerobaculia bacterium]
MFLSRDGLAWDSTSRWTATSELGEPLKVTIRSLDGAKLEFDYESPFSAEYASAVWTWNGTTRAGETRLAGGTGGRAVIAHNRRQKALQGQDWEGTPNAGEVRVRLIQRNRDRTATVGWTSRLGGDKARSGSWSMWSRLHPERDGTLSSAFVLPPFSPSAAMEVRIAGRMGAKGVTLSTESTNAPALRNEKGLFNHYLADAETVRRLASMGGGILRITVEPDAPTAERTSIVIHVKEKRP